MFGPEFKALKIGYRNGAITDVKWQFLALEDSFYLKFVQRSLESCDMLWEYQQIKLNCNLQFKPITISSKSILSISVGRTTVKELEGQAKSTLMSINDLAAYLLGWGELVLKWNVK